MPAFFLANKQYYPHINLFIKKTVKPYKLQQTLLIAILTKDFTLRFSYTVLIRKVLEHIKYKLHKKLLLYKIRQNV